MRADVLFMLSDEGERKSRYYPLTRRIESVKIHFRKLDKVQLYFVRDKENIIPDVSKVISLDCIVKAV